MVRQLAAGSSSNTPRAGEMMGAGGVSGSQMPETPGRKLEPWWGWGAAWQELRLTEGVRDAT